MVLHRLYPEVRVADLSFHHKEPLVRNRKLVTKMIPIQEEGDVWRYQPKRQTQ